MLQIDIKTAFLYGDLEEQIFMEIPEGLRDGMADGELVCRLQKSCYGLQQAARCWNKKFTGELKRLGLIQCASDQCLFRGTIKNEEVFLALFVDDGLVAAKSQKVIQIVKNALCESFEVKLGDSCRFVGVQIERDRKNKRMLFGMMNANPMCIPVDPNQILSRNAGEGRKVEESVPFREAVGSLMFLAVITRPRFAYAVNDVSRFLADHDESHWNAVKRIIKYLTGTRDLGIFYEAHNDGIVLTGFSDSDYAGDVDTRRSTTGFCFFFSNGIVTWSCERQRIVALSSTEAEYVAAAAAAKEAIWLRRILRDLNFVQCFPTTLFVDNQSAIRLAINPEFHKRSKHIDVRCHFIRELIENKELIVKYIATTEQK